MTAEVSFDRQPTFDDESRPAAVSPEADFRLGNWKGHSRAKATIRSSRTVRDGRWLAKAKLARRWNRWHRQRRGRPCWTWFRANAPGAQSRFGNGVRSALIFIEFFTAVGRTDLLEFGHFSVELIW